MPVPTSIEDLSQTAGSNSPAGSESPATTDDFFRAHASFIAELRDGQGYSAEVDVASAATCDIGGAASFLVRITGTTTITSFGTNYNGPRFVRFAGALTLTHHATNLILPGAANITTAAGDTCIATPTGAGWVVSGYKERAASETVSGVVELATTAEVQAGTDTARAITPAALRAGGLVAATAVSASGTAVNFTDIPSWVKRITGTLVDVSTSGSSLPIVQIGDSGGVETSAYSGSAWSLTAGSGAANSTGFNIMSSIAGSTVLRGSFVLVRHDTSNTWVSTSSINPDSTNLHLGTGTKQLSATLDRVRITMVNGTDTFDAGTINVLYE